MDLIFIIGVFYLFATAYGVLLTGSRPDLSFWLLLNMYFDPGGYLSYITAPLLGRFDFNDIIIVFLVLNLSRINGKRQMINQNLLLKRFLTAFAWFVAFYFIIYGAVVPFIKDDANYAVFLLKNRRFIYGIILLFGVYIFALRGLKYLYQTVLFTALATLIFFFISLVLKIPLIQITEMERYVGSGMLRIGMPSYSIFDLVFSVALIVFFLSRKISLILIHKRILFFVGILMLITFLLTLTRRTYIDIAGSFILVIYLITKISKGKVTNVYFKSLIAVFAAIFLLFIIQPIYLGVVNKVATDTALLITTGKDTRGETEQRLTGEGVYEDVFKEIENNILFGTGYTYFQWDFVKSMGSISATSTRGLDFGQLADAAAEIPLLNLFFSFGIVGALFLLGLYTKMYVMARNIYRLLRIHYNIMITRMPLQLVFSILIVLWIAKLFTYNFWNIGGQFIGADFQINAVYLGLGFAMLQINIKLRNENYENTRIGATHR